MESYKEEVWVITLNKEERDWLRILMQNPLVNGNLMDSEDAQGYAMRHKIFDALSP